MSNPWRLLARPASAVLAERRSRLAAIAAGSCCERFAIYHAGA